MALPADLILPRLKLRCVCVCVCVWGGGGEGEGRGYSYIWHRMNELVEWPPRYMIRPLFFNKKYMTRFVCAH